MGITTSGNGQTQLISPGGLGLDYTMHVAEIRGGQVTRYPRLNWSHDHHGSRQHEYRHPTLSMVKHYDHPSQNFVISLGANIAGKYGLQSG